MMLARSLRVLLAVALLVAWTNSLVHPIEHVDEAGEFIHLVGGHEGNGHEGEGGGPNAQCDALAAVAACVAGSAALDFAVPQGIDVLPARHAARFRHPPLLAYRSQAPPQYS